MDKETNTGISLAIDRLSDEASYQKLFHAYRDEEELPSTKVLKEVVGLCRAILFPGYYGPARVCRQTIHFHTGVLVEQLHTLLSKEIYAGLCFADPDCPECNQSALWSKAASRSCAARRRST